jgi:hypothetical protein
MAHDWSWIRDAASSPEMTMDLYLEMPEDLSRQIEVEDGRIVAANPRAPATSGSHAT